MASRWVALGAAAVAAAVVGLVIALPFLRDARLLPAVNPQPHPLFEAEVLPLAPDEQACMRNATVDERSEVAYVKVGTRRKPAVPLAFSASGEGFRAAATHPPIYEDNDVVSFPVDPPASPTRTQLCVRNEGRRTVDLYAAADRTRTRVDTFVDGELVRPNFSIWFTEKFEHSLGRRSPTIAERMATFRPGGAWLPWLVTILLLAGIPLALVLALWRSAAHDEEADDR